VLYSDFLISPSPPFAATISYYSIDAFFRDFGLRILVTSEYHVSRFQIGIEIISVPSFKKKKKKKKKIAATPITLRGIIL